jgi:hypothetical protein
MNSLIKTTEIILDASMEVALDGNIEKNMSRDLNIRKSHNI